MATFIHGSAVVFVFSLIGFLITFLYKLLAARYLGSSEFGVFSLIETIVGIAFLIVSLGIPEGIVRYFPIYFHKRDVKLLSGYMRFAFLVPLFFSLVIGILLFAFSSNITAYFDFPSNFTILMQIISLSLPFRVINSIFRKYFLARKKVIYSQVAYNFIEKTIPLIFLVIAYILKLDIIFIVWGLVFSVIISAIYCVVVYYKKLPFVFSKKRTYVVSEWLKFSLPLFFSALFVMVIAWSDNIFIGKFLTSADLGVYSVAFSLAGISLIFLNMFLPLFLPLLSEFKAKKKYDDLLFLFKKASSWIFGLTFPVFLFFLFFSKKVLFLLYGPEFVSGYLALVILSGGIVVHSYFGFANQLLLLYKKTNWLFAVNIVIVSLNIVLNIVFIQLWGFLGAAIASASSLILGNITFFIFARKLIKVRLDLVALPKYFFSGVLASSAFVTLMFFPQNIFWYMISCLVFSGLYMFFVLLLRTFSQEELHILELAEKKIGMSFTNHIKHLFKK